MKISKSQLKQIIKEEIETVLDEGREELQAIAQKVIRQIDPAKMDAKTQEAFRGKYARHANRAMGKELNDPWGMGWVNSIIQGGALEENLQEAYSEKRLAKAMARPMKDPGSYYYNLKSSSEDPSSYYGGEDNRTEEVKAINQIANSMYNLDLMIGQAKKLPERIQQVQQSIQQAASMEGAAAEEAKKAEQALQSLLQDMPKL